MEVLLKMKNKWFVSLMAGVTLLSASFAGEAAQLDVYRNMLAQHSFTLKYNIAPTIMLEQEHNRSGMGEFASSGINWSNRPNQGTIVVDGTTCYMDKFDDGSSMVLVSPYSLPDGAKTMDELIKEKGEKSSTVTHMCMLIKNGETFSYYRYDNEKGKPRYAGRVSDGWERSQVVAGEHYTARNPFDAMMQETDYGDPRIAKMLAIISPPDPAQTFFDTPAYSLVNSGTLASGLSYEDYAASKGGRYYAARYYFDQGQLVKFASVSFPQSLDVAQGGVERNLITIEEFSPVPDSQYLSLPDGIRDVTKRGEK